VVVGGTRVTVGVIVGSDVNVGGIGVDVGSGVGAGAHPLTNRRTNKRSIDPIDFFMTFISF